ncbi:MAG: sensor histidine kinase [Gaiellaceae bacterium]|jgi:signal transduction histidine kinase
MIRQSLKQRKGDLIDLGLVALLLPPTFVWATRHHSLALAAAPVLAQVLPLLLRRRFPLAVLAVVLAASISTQFVVGVLPPFALALAVYTVASHTERRFSLWAGAVTLAALPLVLIQHAGVSTGESVLHLVVFVSAAWILGDNVRTKRAYYRELEERAERLERERELNVRRAAAEEQERIARELHDVIAHSVSVMVVQAAAAGDVFERQPERAREALRSIEESGRSALTELRRLLGVVRTRERERLEPQPGLAALAELVEQVRATGLEVDLELKGELTELPSGVDLSAYRIIQEALTNTLKHAQASRARVRLSRHGGELELEIADDGAGPSKESRDGHGLIGMQERAALLGGVFTAGVAEKGGFVVRARFPLADQGQLG